MIFQKVHDSPQVYNFFSKKRKTEKLHNITTFILKLFWLFHRILKIVPVEYM